MIERLRLQNFTAFRDLDIDLSAKINLIIGENGTGKTHLLKAAYALCSGNRASVGRKTPSSAEELQATLTERLIRIFLPLDDKLGKLRTQGTTEGTLLEADFVLDKKIAVSFHANSKTVSVVENVDYERYSWQPVFIPTKEVLSFMKGFSSLYDKYELSFDQTYRELCLFLDLPELRSENLQQKPRWAMDEIQALCGGRFLFHGGGKVTFKADGIEYSVNVMAEGFRKIGILSRLLETGVIQPGASGPLFWDEPEANVNPKVTRLLVKILIELARLGQQVVIATHDYFVLKWFHLEANKAEGDSVRYHALHRDPATGLLAVNTTDDYDAVAPNAIDETFEAVINSEIDRSIGSLGK